MSDIIVEIAGTDYSKYVMNFQLQQKSFGHHQFQLEIRTDAMQEGSALLLDETLSLIGTDFKIAWLQDLSLVDDFDSQEVFFKGIVTGVRTNRSGASSGVILIEGKSPTILIDDGAHCRSFEKKTLSAILDDALSKYTSNIFKEVKNKPIKDIQKDYIVQYNESTFQFLNRLAARHGEWMYYDGNNLVFGHKENGDADIKLTFDQDLKSFGVSAQTLSPNFSYLSRDFINDTTQLVKTSEVNSQKMGEIGAKVYNNLSNLYSHNTNIHNNSSLSENQEKELMRSLAEKDKAAIAANLVIFDGDCDNFLLKPGISFTVQSSEGEPMLDKYYVTSVTHYWSKNTGYHNQFNAIEAAVEIPPYANVHDFPMSYSQTATVLDNKDPLAIGRIQVQLEWQTDEDAHPWVRMSQPHSGGEKGFYFIPEVGEEVIVGFEGGNAEKPYVAGTYHNTGHKSPNSDPDQKMIKTKSGNTIHLDDAAGSVRINDSGKADIFLDGEGNTVINSTETITLSCGDSTIKLVKNGDIIINGKSIGMLGSADVTVGAGGESPDAGFSLESSGDVNIGGTNVNIAAKSELSANSAKTSVGGTAETKIQGGTLSLN